MDTLDEMLERQNTFMLSQSNYCYRNLGKILESTSSRLASNIA